MKYILNNVNKCYNINNRYDNKSYPLIIRGCSADETDGAKKMKQMVQKKMEHLVITVNDYKFINHINSHFVTQFNALAPASAGRTYRNLAWTQLAQKLGI